jgi:vacuolar protein sorting-associated protein 26
MVKFRNIEYEQEFAVIRPDFPDVLKQDNQPIKLEVGIEDWLHLVFDVDSRNFGLKDIIKGKVTFKKVSIRMKSMEIQIIRKESVTVQGVEPDTNVITKYEIMDGGPIKNETIPIRFFLKPYDLTPTFKNINNRFSVQYFINLVLTDVEDRKYFKQHEIFLFRIDKNKKVIPDNTMFMMGQNFM